MRDADITGMKHMWIHHFNLQLAGLFLTMNFTIPLMQIVGDHTTTTSMGALPVTGTGRINMDCRNVYISTRGQMSTIANNRMNLNFLESWVAVGSADVAITGFGVLDGTMGRMIGAATPALIADNQERVNDELNSVLVPAMNKFLNQHTMVTLVNLMADRNQNPLPRRCFW